MTDGEYTPLTRADKIVLATAGLALALSCGLAAGGAWCVWKLVTG